MTVNGFVSGLLEVQSTVEVHCGCWSILKVAESSTFMDVVGILVSNNEK